MHACSSTVHTHTRMHACSSLPSHGHLGARVSHAQHRAHTVHQSPAALTQSHARMLLSHHTVTHRPPARAHSAEPAARTLAHRRRSPLAHESLAHTLYSSPLRIVHTLLIHPTTRPLHTLLPSSPAAHLASTRQNRTRSLRAPTGSFIARSTLSRPIVLPVTECFTALFVSAR